MPLTDRTIKNAKPKAKPYKLYDTEGMYLLINPGGSKLWRLKYRFGGKENILLMGSYPLISLTEAREARYQAKKLLLVNISPNAKKKEERLTAIFDANNSFKAVATDWHNTNKKKWTDENAQRIWRRLELYAFPHIGSRAVAHIKTPELVLILRKIEEQRKTETAKQLIQTLNWVFRFAVHSGILDRNPASDLRGVIAPRPATHFPAISPGELPALIRQLNSTATSQQNRIAVKLLMHLFLRPGELRYGKWSEIDWANSVWLVPAERMKIKNRGPHVVPLSNQAIALLRALECITGYSDYLFPSQQRRKHPVMSENTINKILKKMGYADKQVAHGFRAVASTVLNESSLFRSDVIEAQLAHSEQNNSRKPYNRAEYIEERVVMMQWWGDYLQAAENSSNSKLRQAA